VIDVVSTHRPFHCTNTPGFTFDAYPTEPNVTVHEPAEITEVQEAKAVGQEDFQE
jgi:hypothetical protein